ncbi:MAG: FtsX-like permease family protein [Propionibacteriaceae bacterium]
MRTLPWLSGLLRRRTLELAIAAVSVALTVAFVASIGAFVTQSRAALTVRAAASVPVDWQIQVNPQGNTAEIAAAASQVPDVRTLQQVSFAKVDSLVSGGGAQGQRKTGAAYVVGIPAGYAAAFPAEIRPLLGSTSGPLLFQQTAANLAAVPGSTIQVHTGSGSHRVTVAGIVDLPYADSLFQVVGLAPGAGASPPPDNVLLVPSTTFAALVGRTPVVTQLHVGFVHSTLPTDPQTAAVAVAGRADHLQVALAGGALVGDNLGTALVAAGEDATYANLLFLLLGLPGLALAAVVAGLVVTLRSERRRREIALLRLRGATTSQVGRVVTGEALATAGLGALLGVPLALAAVRLALPTGTQLPTGWTVAAVLVGFVLSLLTQGGPVLRLALGRDRTAVAAEASSAVVMTSPWPLRLGLDILLLVGAGVAFAYTARSGYRVVLAPEGIPQTQVNYAALLGPALAWPGLALLVWRLSAWTAGRSTGRLARTRTGRAPELEAAAVRRRRRTIARGAAGLAAALGLAVSTAVFTATYQAQSRVDVALTVGSDVAVVEPPGAKVGPSAAVDLAAVPGVTAVEPLQHRFAYVGPDLQDVYGVQASTFGRVAPLQDAFVPGSTVKKTLSALQHTPDGVLLSAETLHDYQLHPGDLIRLRLQTGPDHAYRPINFHVIGQVTEWPTAPKDSFIVANAGYLAQATGSDAVGTFLVSSDHPATTAGAMRTHLVRQGSVAHVIDIASGGAKVTSATGLAATDLSGLSRLELGFGVVFAIACSGLALLGGIVERRRALVLLAALGADARQRGRFLTAEARVMVACGIAGGTVIGGAIAYLLVKVLTGIFDPAPAAPTIPWTYLTGLLLLVTVLSALVVAVAGRLVSRAGPSELRDL